MTNRVKGSVQRFLAICIVAILFVGCADTKQYTTLPDQTKRIEDPAKARVYLLRLARGFGDGAVFQFSATVPEATGPYISRDFRVVGELGPGRYLCWEMSPGKLLMNAGQKDFKKQFVLNLEAGNVYYLQAHLHAGWTRPSATVELLSDEEGRALLERCKPPESEFKTHH